MRKEQDKKDVEGFTLLEVLVAMTIFVFVISVVTGAFAVALRSRLRVIQNQESIEDIRFALEKMARVIRVSTVTTNDTAATSTLRLEHPTLGTVSYDYSSFFNAIFENGGRLTSDNVKVTNLTFIVSGKADPNRQVRVSIVIGAESPLSKPEAKTTLKAMTTISPRVLQP